ncbi:MAG: dihydrofolate reductase [Chloroflexaceae bacterium]|nr:dihydrofolate reductase [Chloroflexaceae bacterium]NJL34697.1 dihydrofolate reductase [Chloroflexaceae bacterium]NJO07672.1 dihydrofolate reductase [Chloroflexaceae bacterium]
MSIVLLDMAMSLDGYIAGPDDADGGLNDWFFDPSRHNAEVVAESLHTTGALIIGRRTYDIGAALNAFADTPYHVPHMVVSHTVPAQTATSPAPFIFVTDGIVSALTQARAAANGKDVVLGGGASIAQQYLRANLIDEIQIHLVPVLLGNGIHLFNRDSSTIQKLEGTRVIGSSGVTHLRYRVVKEATPANR